MIPKNLHFVWVGPAVPWWAKRNIELFRDFNRGYHVTIHGEEVLLECFRKAYDRIDESPQHAWARKADILRVCALLRHGGWYFDVDFLPIRKLVDLERQYHQFPEGCFLAYCSRDHNTGERIVGNGVIAATSESPMLARIAMGIMLQAEIEREIGWNYYGPWLYTTLVGLHPNLVRVAPMEEFCPLQDRDESLAAYRKIAEAGYRFQAIVDVLGTPLPHMLHMAMEGETEL